MLTLRITDTATPIETAPAPITARELAKIQNLCTVYGIVLHYTTLDGRKEPLGATEFNGAKIAYADYAGALDRKVIDAVFEEAAFKGRMMEVRQDGVGQLHLAVSETLSFSDALPQSTPTTRSMLRALELPADAYGRINVNDLAIAMGQSWTRHAFAAAGLHDLYRTLMRFVRGREAASV